MPSELNITFWSLLGSFSLVIVAIVISGWLKLGTLKDIVVASIRMVTQLIIVGYLLTYLFRLDNAWVTIGIVLVMVVNAAFQASRQGIGLNGAFLISLLAIGASTVLSLAVLTATRSISFVPSQVISITGMLAGNAMTAVGLCFRNLKSLFRDNHQAIEERLALGATPLQSAVTIVRESVRLGTQPTIDNTKTIGLVSLPGMMTGLMFAGTVPTAAIKYQIMVMFMLLATTSITSTVASFLAVREFFTPNAQLKRFFL
ncbi:MAG: ABC transporter permease [Saccharofermentanales bacterium]|jgi:putative ABC transport system permease protein